MYSLRYVYMLGDGRVGSLCPACFRGISSALLEIVVQEAEQDASDLVNKLETAIKTEILTPIEVGFAQERIF
jgi:hypothetical protein